MLGATVARFLAEQGLKVLEANRGGVAVTSDSKAIKIGGLNSQDLSSIFKSEEIGYVINCVGLIKQLIVDSSSEKVLEAIKVNSEFPRELEKLANVYNFKVIQIATDCVFSGEKGKYSEEAIHSPVDIYGMTKSLGEVQGPRVMTLRCSIVGPEISGNKSLLSWFLSQPLNGELKGYSNHLWNGLSTLHFSKIIFGIIENNLFKPGVYHLVPSGVASKGELLELFAKYFQRSDLNISLIQAPVSINRTLTTTMPIYNQELWKMAGYTEPPTIEQMIKELAVWTANHSEGVSK
jgi:dTDP-4-dehydrorhamnose reductase